MRKLIILLLVSSFIGLLADFNFARELYEDGLYDEAVNEFETVVKLYPTSLEAERSIFLIAESYRKQQMNLLAETNYQRLLNGYPHCSFKDEVFYSLALVQYELRNFEAARKNLQFIISNYPLSEFSRSSLELYLKCYYQLEQYSTLLEKAEQFRKDYPGNESLPSIMLLMVRTYIKLNSITEARELIAEIYRDHPQNNARWEAVILDLQLMKNSPDAVRKLNELLNEKIPRNYEEIYRMMLAEYYIEEGSYLKAQDQLELLFEKFSHSDNLDKFITSLTFCSLKLGDYHSVLEDREDPKVIRNSDLYDEYLLYQAEALFRLKKINDSLDLLAKIDEISVREKIKFRSKLLKAEILESTGRWIQAVIIYNELLTSEYSTNEELWFRIGDIYQQDLSEFNKAVKYYDMIIANTYNTSYLNKAYYLKALCYEKMENYPAAIQALTGIDPDEIDDMELRNRIQRKLTYLQKFKQPDYQKASSELITSLFQYLENNDDQELKNRIVEILYSDLKEYKQADDLLQGSDPDDVYLKALLNLDLAEKLLIENNNEEAGVHLDRALELAARLDPVSDKARIREISLKKMILKETSPEEIVHNLEDFLTQYPDSPARNEFLIKIIEFYRNQDNKAESVKYITLLDLNDKIGKDKFYKNKLWLAEYYYNNDNDVEARANYELALPAIDLRYPDVIFHYAVTLDQTGEPVNALEKLEFLVNNSDSFPNFVPAVEYLVDLQIERDQYTKAAEFYSYIKEADRNDEYYKQLADILLITGERSEAKEAIMHIQDKDSETLEKLALLQYETDDLEMAKYSYSLLIDRDSSELRYYEMLGQINFLQEQYLESAENYKVVIDALGDPPAQREGLNRISLENIIALYRIGNRPKAETLKKRYKNHLNTVDLYKIRLNEGIYYLDIDAKKAEKIFSNLLKESDIASSNKYNAYFWRGVSRLKLKKQDEAEADFMVTLESSEQKLINQADMKLGTLNFSRENYQQALDHYYKVIVNDDTGELALDAANNFAYVCKTIEEWQKAVAAYEIILDRWGEQSLEGKTLFDIAFCHFRDRRYPDAIEMFSEAILLLEDKELAAEAQYWIGEAWFNMADYEKAITEFLKVSYNYNQFIQWSATAELKTGEAYAKDDKPEKARMIYERIITKFGEMSQWGQEAQRRLALLGTGN